MSRIIGIDPGYGRLGIAVLEHEDRRTAVLCSDCIITPAKTDFNQRLKVIGETFDHWVTEEKPKILAVEKLFVSRNQKTASQVAAVKGAILYLAARHGLRIFEYSPVEIKTTITGFGHSDKKQITTMVERLVSLPERKRYDDEYDAIATALTCLARENDLF